MKKKPSPKPRRRLSKTAMRSEYDFTTGVRGKYAGRLKPGSQIVVLDPDVAAALGNAKAVNRALRTLIDLPKRPARSARRRTAYRQTQPTGRGGPWLLAGAELHEARNGGVRQCGR
jgi:hypothetical protein